MEGIVRDRCPLCGGKIVVSDLYQTSRDKEGDGACQNGRITFGKNLSLF